MNALTPQPPSSTAIKQTLSGLSPALKSLLGIEPSNHRAVSEIVGNPVILAEVTAALPAIKANATTPASHDDIRRIIGARFATYRQPERSDSEWVSFWADYLTVLDGLSVAALEAAMEAILRDPNIEFLPKPAKIAELAKMTPNRAVRAYDRAKAAVDYQAPVQRESLSPDQMADLIRPLGAKRPAEKSEADKARVRQQMREFIAQDEERKRIAKLSARPDTPDTAGPVNERGITTQMEALMGREQTA